VTKFCAPGWGSPRTRASKCGTPKKTLFCHYWLLYCKNGCRQVQTCSISQQALVTCFLDLSTLMTLNPQKGFCWFFCNFWLQRTFKPWIATKWLEIDQNNLRVKFSALNVDFSCRSPDPLVQGGLRSLPSAPKKWLYRFSAKTVADRRRHTAYHNKHWWRAFERCQHRWPWTPKIGVFSFVWNFQLWYTFHKWIAPTWLEIDLDNLQTATAKAVARLISFAQITCTYTK